MNIFVAKLNFDTDSDGLRAAFEAYGTVDSAKVINDRFTGKSRGFGFVEMPDDDQASNAIEALNESDLDGNTIVVKQAEPRERNNRGGRGGYGGRRNDHAGGRDSGGYGGRRDDYSGGSRGDYRERRERDDNGGQRDGSRRRRDHDRSDRY